MLPQNENCPRCRDYSVPSPTPGSSPRGGNASRRYISRTKLVCSRFDSTNKLIRSRLKELPHDAREMKLCNKRFLTISVDRGNGRYQAVSNPSLPSAAFRANSSRFTRILNAARIPIHKWVLRNYHFRWTYIVSLGKNWLQSSDFGSWKLFTAFPYREFLAKEIHRTLALWLENASAWAGKLSSSVWHISMNFMPRVQLRGGRLAFTWQMDSFCVSSYAVEAQDICASADSSVARRSWKNHLASRTGCPSSTRDSGNPRSRVVIRIYTKPHDTIQYVYIPYSFPSCTPSYTTLNPI